MKSQEEQKEMNMDSQATQESTHGKLENLVNKESNTELIKVVDVEGVPWKMVKVDEDWFVGLAGTRVSNRLASEEEAMEVLLNMNSEINLTVIHAMIESYANHHNLLKRIELLEKLITK